MVSRKGKQTVISNGSSAYTLAAGEAGASRLRLLHEVYGASAEALMTELGLSQGMSSVDIGCGIGTISCWMAEQVRAKGCVVGVDISTAQLDVARCDAARLGYAHLRFQRSDANENP